MQRWLAFHPISPSGCSQCLILLLGLCFLHQVWLHHATADTVALAEVPERIKFKLVVLAYRCLHQTAPPYLAEELHQSSADETRQRLRSAVCIDIIACCPTHLSFNHRWSSFSGRCCPTVEHSAVERHVGIVNIFFQETFDTHVSSHSFPVSPVLPVQWIYHFRHYNRSFYLLTTYLENWHNVGHGHKPHILVVAVDVEMCTRPVQRCLKAYVYQAAFWNAKKTIFCK